MDSVTGTLPSTAARIIIIGVPIMSAEHGKTLADLRVGESAVVREVGGERPISLRLMEMGLLPGTRVEIVRVAPLGDPIEIRLRSYALSIRRSEARGVRVAT
jgi:Fe2+ transport system protein FeoA